MIVAQIIGAFLVCYIMHHIFNWLYEKNQRGHSGNEYIKAGVVNYLVLTSLCILYGLDNSYDGSYKPEAGLVIYTLPCLVLLFIDIRKAKKALAASSSEESIKVQTTTTTRFGLVVYWLLNVFAASLFAIDISAGEKGGAAIAGVVIWALNRCGRYIFTGR